MLGRNVSVRKDLHQVKKSVKISFEAVREEMSDHLDSINRNTDEIQAVYDFLADIDSKLNKLSERMDEIDMIINPDMEPRDSRLTSREKEVFMVLYTSKRETTRNVARAIGFTEDMVLDCIYNIQSKGIPIIKEFIGSDTYVSLNPKFKDLQSKKNVLKIELA